MAQTLMSAAPRLVSALGEDFATCPRNIDQRLCEEPITVPLSEPMRFVPPQGNAIGCPGTRVATTRSQAE